MTAQEAWPHIKELAAEKFAESSESKIGISHIKLEELFGITVDDIQDGILRCLDDDEDYSGQYYMGDLIFWKR